MNKTAILKTAETRWDEDDDCYITESPLEEGIVGAGESPEEAFGVFLEMVEMNYQAYLDGRHGLYNRPGRPKKDKVNINTNIDPETKEALLTIAEDLQMTQGELIDCAVSVFKRKLAKKAGTLPKRKKA